MLNKIVNSIYFTLLLFVFGILASISFKNISKNVINFRNITKDRIKNIDENNYRLVTLTNEESINYKTGIKIKIGDTIKYRNRGNNQSDKILFQVNDKKVASMYNEWDLFSPILFLISSFLFIGILITKIKELK